MDKKTKDKRTKENRIKTLIAASVVIMEIFVLSVCSPAWSIGIIGGPDGPLQLYIVDSRSANDLPGEEEEREDISQEAETQRNGQAIEEAEERGLLILVNKQNPVEKDYRPEDLAPIKYYAPDRPSTARYLRAEAAEAFHELVEDAALEGIELVITTAYRSYDLQKILYDNYVEREGREAADRYSAKPGQSEHQTGLATDVSSASVAYQLTDAFGETEEGKWLAGNGYRYGFIMRYPKDKEEITGYIYEPWHIRYVGREAAEEIHQRGLTLEEFLSE